MRLRATWIEQEGSRGIFARAPWWENFIQGRHYISPTWADENDLAEWGATWHKGSMFERWIEFEDEKMATVFLLRWS